MLVDQPDVTAVVAVPELIEATIEEQLAAPCNGSVDQADPDGAGPSFYRLRMLGKPKAAGASAVAVVDPAGQISLRDGTLDADLDGDGTSESFRTCASSEGVHYQVWSGPPLTGQPRFHWYFYAGYDTMPTCTANEYFGSPAQ
jgi:hypothetical protein